MNKTKHLFLTLLFALLAISVHAQSFNYTANGREWKCYEEGPGQAFIVGVTEAAATCSGVLNIPSEVIDQYGRHCSVKGIGYENEYSHMYLRYGFKDYTHITEVYIPASVKEIGKGSFYNCTGLTKVHMPSVEKVKSQAFYGCSALADIDFSNLQEIGESAFQSCGFQGTLTIPNSVTHIGNQAFFTNTHLTGLNLNWSTLQVIGDKAFYGCVGLRGDFLLPASSTTIGTSAFDHCGFDGTLTVLRQANQNNIGSRIFGETHFTNLVIGGEEPFSPRLLDVSDVNLTILPTVKKIVRESFSHMLLKNSILVIPEGVESIGDLAFSYAHTTAAGHYFTVQFPSTLTKISAELFSYSGLGGHVTIPSSVISIERGAFRSTKITGVTLSAGLKEIKDDAFYECSSLAGNLIIPQGVTKIGNNAFYECSNLTGNFTIPNSVTYIGYCAFFDCSGLNADVSSILHSSLTDIGSNAFYNCKGITGEALLPSPYNIIYSTDGNGGNFASSPALPILHTSVWGIKMGPWTNFFHPNEGDNKVFDWLKYTGLFYVDARESTVALTNGKHQPNTCYKFSRKPYMFMESIRYGNFGNASINTLIYLPSESSFNNPALPSKTFDERFEQTSNPSNSFDGENFIMDGKCKYFYVADGLSYRVPIAFTALEAQYDREFNVTTGKAVSTLYLPYPTDLPAGMCAYTLVKKGLDAHGDKAFIFREVPQGTRLSANKPYLVRITDGQPHKLPVMRNVEVPVSPSVESAGQIGIETGDWKFYGTTEKIDNAAAYAKKAYYLNDNKWWAVQNGVENDYIAPFRCFVSSPTGAAAARSFVMVLDGDDDSNVTGINQLESDTEKDMHSGKYPFYSIDGKLMGKDYNKLERGQIYIVNGKKFYKF